MKVTIKEFKDNIMQQGIITEEEFAEVQKDQQEFIDNLINQGLIKKTDTDKIEDFLIRKMYSALSKRFNVQVENYEGWVLGMSDITDFGIGKYYTDIKNKWELSDETMKQNMIDTGEVNQSGEPLWVAEKTRQEWKIGKPIDVEEAKQRNLLGLFRNIDTNGDYKIAPITLQSDKLNLNIPLNTKIKAKFKGNEKDNILYLQSRSVTNVEVMGKKMAVDEYKNLINKYFKDYIIDCNEAGFIDVIKSLEQNKNYFFINACPVKCNDKNEFKNLIEIGDITNTGLKDSTISVWVDKQFKLPPESISNIIILGRVNSYDDKNTQKKRFSIRAMSIFVEDEIQIEEIQM